MKLRDLLKKVKVVELQGDDSVEILSLCYDSRKAGEGSLFFAIKGFRQDGNQFVKDAVEKGAIAVVSEREPLVKEVTWVQVENARQAMADIAAEFFGNPSEKLKVVGVTGTNGKTTTVLLTAEILSKAGKCGYISTVDIYYGEKVKPSLTTPESVDVHRMLYKMVENGFDYAVIEVSSHALHLDRVRKVDFDVAVFTNLSGDHLDFHLTMDRYFEAKAKLFKMLRGADKWAIINGDDEYGRRLLEICESGSLTYGFKPWSSLYPLSLKFDLNGTEGKISTPIKTINFKSNLIGKANVYNIMAAAGAAIALGVEKELVEKGISSFKGVKGRLEKFESRKGYFVFVDYAHTDDALRKVLESLRELPHRRIIVVFGAGGDRDRSKRPRMGRVAGELADIVVLTSDNPRSEDPYKIIEEIETGVKEKTSLYMKEVDRKKAIEKALSMARKGDIVLIAGKGHETYQIFADRVVPFSDQEIVKEILEREE